MEAVVAIANRCLDIDEQWCAGVEAFPFLQWCPVTLTSFQTTSTHAGVDSFLFHGLAKEFVSLKKSSTCFGSATCQLTSGVTRFDSGDSTEGSGW